MAPSPPWSRRDELVATTAFWVLLTGLLLIRRALSPVALTPSSVVGTIAEYGVWIVLTPVVFALARRFPLEHGRLARRIVVLLGIGLAMAASIEMVRTALLIGLVDVGLLEELPRGPFGARRGPGAPGDPSLRPTAFDGLLRFQFIDEFVLYAGVLAAGFARNYALRAFDRETESVRLAAEAAGLQAERAQLEGQLAEARLAALRMQLNPHFLFNALNTVSAFIERDPERAQTMVAQLAGLLRRVLDGDKRSEIPLADELAILRDYLAIQEARFGDGLVVEERVDPDTLDALVPPLLLQPLAENAVEHGVSRLVGQAGRIQVSAHLADGARQLVLTITDNGPGPNAPGAQHGSGVGLANTRDRLQALYGDTAHLTLGPAPGGGCVATATLPHHSPEAAHA